MRHINSEERYRGYDILEETNGLVTVFNGSVGIGRFFSVAEAKKTLNGLPLLATDKDDEPRRIPNRRATMNPICHTVGDLRALLKDLSDDTPLGVAAAPDVSGWVSGVLGINGHDQNGRFVLALAEETFDADESDLTWTDTAGNPVRPV